MEAVPRLPMICFELKVSHENASFGPKLKQYIADFYREEPESYNNEIYQLEGLRSAAVRPALDLSGCIALKRYFSQLKSLQSRFPMNKGQLATVSFAWRDLFANIVCTLADVRFEMVCILYNIGALHCKLGAGESRTSPESMKSACTHFQSAAWAFQYLREHYPQPSGIDLSPEVMKLFQDICLAQAQECILEKSMLDNRKPSIVNAIGMQALIYYRNALHVLESSQTADSFQENVGSKICSAWIKYLSFKIAYMSCVVYLFQGMESEESQKMGERVSFYQAACDRLTEAKKLSKGLPSIEAINETLSYVNDIVEGKRKAAKNENEFIYHEEVPDKDSLSEPKPASLAKGIPVNFGDPEVAGSDIFGRLIPMGAHEASSMYSEEKAKLLRKIVDAVEAKDIQLHEFMSSLQLDQLDALEHPESLPEELIDRCASLSVKTDVIENLVESMNNLSDLHTEVENMLVDIKDLLQEEDKNEKEYQKIMGSRQPSIVNTELSREANKYLEAHNKANESNQTLQKAMTLHLTNLKVLVLPLDEIQNHVPSLSTVKDNVDHSSMAEMKMLVSKVNEMQSQRKMLVDMLREAVNTDDITSQLLTRQGETLDDIFKQEIEKHNKQVGLIEQNLLAQENILKALTDSYAKYATSRKLITDVVRKREASIIALITSYDTYEDLLNKLLKGLEFYRKLSANVKKLHTRVKSTCKVQEEERSQLLASHSTKKGISKSNDSSYSPSQISNIPKDTSASSAPKLKDFLPYMKNRTSTLSADSAAVDGSYGGQMYPPYIRPAPVGSEGTNESAPCSYNDTMSVNPQMYPTDTYKAYQYSHSMSGQYQQPTITAQYSQFDSSYVKPDSTNLGYYQQYDMGLKPSESMPSARQTSSMNQYHSTSTSDVQYGQYGYNDTNQTNYQNIYSQPDSYTNTQSYQSYNPQAGGASMPPSAQSYDSAMTQMMDKMSVSSSAVSPNLYNSSNPKPPIAAAQTTNLYNSTNTNFSSQVSQYGYSDATSASQYSSMYNQPNPTLTPLSTQNSNLYNPPVSSPAVVLQQIPNVYSISSDTSQTPTSSPYHNYCNLQQPTNSQVTDPPLGQNQYVNLPQQAAYSTSDTYKSNIFQSGVVNTSEASAFNNPYYVMSPSGEQTPEMINPQSTTNAAGNYSQQQGTVDLKAMYSYNGPNTQTYPSAQSANSSVYSQYSTDPQGYNVPTEKLSDTQQIQSHTITQQFQDNYSQPNADQQYSYYNQEAGATNMTGNPVSQLHQNSIYSQQSSYQSHPGYVYNHQTGVYEYSYGYQQTSGTVSQDTQSPVSDNSQKSVYTNAGICGTIQTSSGSQDVPPDSTAEVQSGSSHYYSLPYGHQSVGYADPSCSSSQSEAAVVETSSSVVNKISNQQQSSMTYSTPDTKTVTTNSDQGSGNIPSPTELNETKKIPPTDSKSEPSTMDLLSGLDFTIDHKPLIPEIKVPPVSEHVIRKIPSQDEKANPLEKEVPSIDDDVLNAEKPPKRDIFCEPSLLNKFTQEVKSLQMFVDSFTKKTHSGITMLDSKWKKIQEAQAKENSAKSTRIGKDHLGKNASPDVLPYDDTRVLLKGCGDDDYINASHVRNISPWAIPMIVSDLPIEENYLNFWHMIYHEKVAIIVCLLTEIELQGKFYGPMTKNQKLELSSDLSVILSEIKCNVNWTKRKLIVHHENKQHRVTHYQINVFPARIVSSPIVLLVDKVLKNHEENMERNPKSKALIHCSTGAGRSSLIVLLTMVMCQVRAGYIQLKDTLDSGFLYLCGTRTNVLEDTKYLVDIYRTVLFYVQGVLCSGTSMFNGEAVSVPSGASVPPQHIPSNPNRPSQDSFSKLSRESFEEMKQAAGLKSGDMKDPLSYLDPLWSLKKRKE